MKTRVRTKYAPIRQNPPLLQDAIVSEQKRDWLTDCSLQTCSLWWATADSRTPACRQVSPVCLACMFTIGWSAATSGVEVGLSPNLSLKLEVGASGRLKRLPLKMTRGANMTRKRAVVFTAVWAVVFAILLASPPVAAESSSPANEMTTEMQAAKRISLRAHHDFSDRETSVRPERALVKEQSCTAFLNQTGSPMARVPKKIELPFFGRGSVDRDWRVESLAHRHLCRLALSCSSAVTS